MKTAHMQLCFHVYHLRNNRGLTSFLKWYIMHQCPLLIVLASVVQKKSSCFYIYMEIQFIITITFAVQRRSGSCWVIYSFVYTHKRKQGSFHVHRTEKSVKTFMDFTLIKAVLGHCFFFSCIVVRLTQQQTTKGESRRALKQMCYSSTL